MASVRLGESCLELWRISRVRLIENTLGCRAVPACRGREGISLPSTAIAAMQIG